MHPFSVQQSQPQPQSQQQQQQQSHPETPFALSLPLHRAPHSHHHPDQRPHTVHATSPFHALSREAPIHSAAMKAAVDMHPDRRLSRDDTAADISVPRLAPSSQYHRLKSDLNLPGLSSWPQHVHLDNGRDFWSSRKVTAFRVPTAAASTSEASSYTHIPADAASSSSSSSSSRPALASRRFSKSYKDGLKDGFKDFRDRIRRASTPQQVEPFPPFNPSGPSTVPPTSPSKRGGRHGDDRPKKHVRNLLVSGDRKDTPAPPPLNLLRPTSRHFTPGFVSAVNGGDRARQSAAAWKHTVPQLPEPQWSDEEDLQNRRSRVGSLSSAADSGADLSCRSTDGEMDIDYEAPALPKAYDFVRTLPSEISLQIFEYLDFPDLSIAESVSSYWKVMANETSVWRNAFLRRYQRDVFTDPAPVQVGGAGCGLPNRPNQEWRKMYKARLELEKNWRKGPKDAGKAVYLAGHTDSVYCLQFDEEKIITGSRDRTIRVWDINNFTCKMVIGGPNVKPTPGPKVLRTVDYPDFHIATASVNGTAYGDSIFKVPSQWHDASILCLQYDEKILVTGSSDCDLLVWDIKTFEPIQRLRKHSGGVLDVALDAKHIVSCSKDSRIIVWDRETYEPKGELTGHKGPVNAVQLRGKFLASASGDGIARLWDVEQMKLIREFPQKERGLAAVEFSEDMKYVLAGGNDTVTYKFEVESGREVKQFLGHTQLVRSLWLDGANNRVVTGSYDLDIRVYDFETGEQLWRAEEWTTSWMLAAKSDYRRIVATSQDGRILIIDFGLHKGTDIRDGQPLEDVDLLRGLEHTSAIRWRDPWQHDRELQRLGTRVEHRLRQSSVAANGVAPILSFW